VFESFISTLGVIPDMALRLKSGICNWADDNTIYSHNHNFDNVVGDLEIKMTKAIIWFQINCLAPNPVKFDIFSRSLFT
jgi:hypothetical protein